MKPRNTPFCISHQKYLARYLISILDSLDGVEENPVYHPEADCLYHSLQVFQHSLSETNNPTLWAAALFHDVGKSVDYGHHETVGSDMLRGLLSPKITWLTLHHLDLLKFPKKTRQKWKGTQQLSDLESLRRWDLAGRQPTAFVMTAQEAVDVLHPYFDLLTQQNDTYCNIANT